MNTEARKHLSKAERLIAKGDSFYAQAADEIIAAMAADPTLSQRVVGEHFGKGHKWVGTLVAWRTSGSPESTPIDWQRGGHATTSEIQAGAKKLLAEAPLEQVEQIVAALPQQRKQAILAAVGDDYAAFRQAHEEKERNLTPAERKEREAAGQALTAPIDKFLASIAILEVVGALSEAKVALGQMIAHSALNPDNLAQIEDELGLFLAELELARTMVNLDERSTA